MHILHRSENDMRNIVRPLAAFVVIAACSSAPTQTPAVGPSPAVTPPVTRPAPAPAPTRSSASFRTATAMIRDVAGARVGEATFTDSYAGLIIAGFVEGLGIGAHGIHIHEAGKCDPPFTTAGGHFNPEKHKHGFRNPDGHHLGDLPNIDVPPSGRLRFEFLLTDVTLRGPHGLLDGNGASIVIHSTRDDFATDPAGNSGSRLACGVIVQS
jgi:superoxide dismutase, Cu-Zn family